jgi:predicted nuclease with TOPRIM domain
MSDDGNVAAAEAALASRVADIERDIRRTNENVKRLEQEAAKAREAERAMEVEVTTLRTTLENLESRVTRNEAGIADMRTKLSDLDTRYAKNEATTAEHALRIAAIEAEASRASLERERRLALSIYIGRLDDLYSHIKDDVVRYIHSDVCLKLFKQHSLPNALADSFADYDHVRAIILKMEQYIAAVSDATRCEGIRVVQADRDAVVTDDLVLRLQRIDKEVNAQCQSLNAELIRLDQQDSSLGQEERLLSQPESTKDHVRRWREAAVLTIMTAAVYAGFYFIAPGSATPLVWVLIATVAGLASGYLRITARDRHRSALPGRMRKQHQRRAAVHASDAEARRAVDSRVSKIERALRSHGYQGLPIDASARPVVSVDVAQFAQLRHDSFAQLLARHPEYTLVRIPT